MNAITVKNLKKHFGKTKAVDGITFNVGEGEIVGFLGPNGAGKTTTIRAMMDFIRPTSGTIEILGLDAQKNSAELKNEIGYLSSESTLYDSWKGEEHIKFLENIRGNTDLDEKLVKNLKLDTRKKAKALSTGNRRKLGVTLALMHQPKLLILDEPTVGLDPLLQNYIYDLLKEQTAKGKTVFMSSHNLAEVEKVCDRVIVLREGKIVAIEKIDELRAKKIYTINIHFDGSIPKKDLSGDGAQVIEEFADGLSLKVKGDIKPILAKISSQKNLKDVEINHANLEEIFMEYYE